MADGNMAGMMIHGPATQNHPRSAFKSELRKTAHNLPTMTLKKQQVKSRSTETPI
jgi:hypothetical protein